MKTIVQLLREAYERVDGQRNLRNDGAREFALAATSIEEAIMRVNRGFVLAAQGELDHIDVEAELAKGGA